MELIDIYLTQPQQGDYIIACAVGEDDRPLGYVCYGPTPLTDGVYDLYWIVVAPKHQGKGIGGELLRYVEEKVGERGARMLLVETSSQPKYRGARAFYEGRGFVEVARVTDFYSIGDDKIIYRKTFESSKKKDWKHLF
ncbi:MAG: GNAT family N-acetyltransferase [bacterium]